MRSFSIMLFAFVFCVAIGNLKGRYLLLEVDQETESNRDSFVPVPHYPWLNDVGVGEFCVIGRPSKMQCRGSLSCIAFKFPNVWELIGKKYGKKVDGVCMRGTDS